MDKVIKEMEENKNIIIDGKFVYELEQELKRKEQECERLITKNAENYKTACENQRKLNKYRKAIKDIRDIANEIVKEKVHNPDIDTVLAIINEVIGVEE